jgi:hypothetical protein
VLAAESHGEHLPNWLVARGPGMVVLPCADCLLMSSVSRVEWHVGLRARANEDCGITIKVTFEAGNHCYASYRANVQSIPGNAVSPWAGEMFSAPAPVMLCSGSEPARHDAGPRC